MKPDERTNGEPGRVEIVIPDEELAIKETSSRAPMMYLFGVGFFLYLWFLGINVIGQIAVALKHAGHSVIARNDALTSLSLFVFPLLGCLVFLWIVVRWAKSAGLPLR